MQLIIGQEAYRPITRLWEEQVTIVQLHGSTASPSQLSRTPWGSLNPDFMPIKACTSYTKPISRFLREYNPSRNRKRITRGYMVVPSKFTPLGESRAIAELEKQRNMMAQSAASISLLIPIDENDNRNSWLSIGSDEEASLNLHLKTKLCWKFHCDGCCASPRKVAHWFVLYKGRVACCHGSGACHQK